MKNQKKAYIQLLRNFFRNWLSCFGQEIITNYPIMNLSWAIWNVSGHHYRLASLEDLCDKQLLACELAHKGLIIIW